MQPHSLLQAGLEDGEARSCNCGFQVGIRQLYHALRAHSRRRRTHSG